MGEESHFVFETLRLRSERRALLTRAFTIAEVTSGANYTVIQPVRLLAEGRTQDDRLPPDSYREQAGRISL